jgi:hypothetical protein
VALSPIEVFDLYIDTLLGCPSVFDQKARHDSISAIKKQETSKFKAFCMRNGQKSGTLRILGRTFLKKLDCHT